MNPELYSGAVCGEIPHKIESGNRKKDKQNYRSRKKHDKAQRAGNNALVHGSPKERAREQNR
jgi:hypothetical protein